MEQSDQNLYHYAMELAHRFIITDGHVDLPYRLQIKNFRLDREYMGIPIQTSEGDFDYERAKQGGLDLDSEIREARTANRKELESRLSAAGLKADDPLAKPIIDAFRKEHPELYSDVQRVADHIDHVREIAGIDHIGLGSDFDGVGDSMPTGLKDVSMYPNLIYELLKRDYSEEDIEKICYKNVWRVWNTVNQIAASR
jgi:hypothetical protein